MSVLISSPDDAAPAARALRSFRCDGLPAEEREEPTARIALCENESGEKERKKAEGEGRSV